MILTGYIICTSIFKFL